MSRIGARLERWFAERLPAAAVKDFLRSQARKPLPPHTSWLHTFGSLSLFLLANQIVTGILLMVYYRPTTEHAFESVRYISAKVDFGWLIRGLHAWGATLMIVMVLLHMMRTFFMGAFKKPRETTWVVGVLLFAGTLTFGFTGYLLPWNQLSYWATTVGTEFAGAIPAIGPGIKRLLLGGDAVSQETLSRFYVTHVIVLPWLIVGGVALHLALMRAQGLATRDPADEEKPAGGPGWLPFFPDHVLKELTLWSVFLAFLLTLVVLRPEEVGEKADPLVTPEGVKPEWYFLSTYQLLKYFPKLIGLMVAVVPSLLLLLWPFLDRSRERRFSRRPISVSIGIAALAIAIVMGLLGHVSERELSILGARYKFSERGWPTRVP